MEFETSDPVVMHDRMRTLSAELMLVFDDNHVANLFTLPNLKRFLMKNPCDACFETDPKKMEVHLERVGKAAEIIERCCTMRLERYKQLGGE